MNAIELVRSGQLLFLDRDFGAAADGIEKLDDVARAHADAAVAGWLADVALFRRAMDVDAAPEGVSVAGLQPVEPQDPGDDRIASGRIDFDDLSGRTTAFEDCAGRRSPADFLFDAQRAERGGVAARPVSEAELRG